MRFWKTSSAILVAGIVIAGAAIMIHLHARTNWLNQTLNELSQCPPPPPISNERDRPAKWAQDSYLIFSNGWAGFRSHTFHDPGWLGDAAVLSCTNGEAYVSHYHFCVIDGEFSGRPQPRDLADFVATYQRVQGWEPIAR